MIGAIIIALIVWGPQKIPELAKAIGEAKHELQTASRGEYDKRHNQEIPNQQGLTGSREILEE
jgi:sec-independent protein translocase protein TatA